MIAPIAADWLVDTLVATTILCAAVMLVRRPVARLFGPHIAYALWAIPAARMILPPLPNLFLAPSEPAVITYTVDAAPGAILPSPAFSPSSLATNVTIPAWVPAAIFMLWLVGVLLHLGWQWVVHRRLIASLAQAPTDSWIGRVRIINSPLVAGPMSLGLFQPLVVLPDPAISDFDQMERTLAVDHELAHHRRGDLWANLGALLFAALHWFNPFIRPVWRAFRFDQEAACDATVLAAADSPRRIRYARALAKTATGHPSAFAAPALASAMLGTENLKERLSMLNQPAPTPLRRRIGLTLCSAAAIAALGLTATPVLADPPAAPAPPPAPPMVEGAQTVDVSIEDGQHVTRIVRNGQTITLVSDHPIDQSRIDQLVNDAERTRAGADQTHPTADRAAGDADGNGASRIRTIIVNHGGAVRGGDAAQHAAQQRVTENVFVFRNSGAEFDPVTIATDCGEGESATNMLDQRGDADGQATRVRVVSCGDALAPPALRLTAMRAARAAMADALMAQTLPGEARANALAAIDAEIAVLERSTGTQP